MVDLSIFCHIIIFYLYFLIWFNSFNFILNWFLKGRINTLRSRLIMRLILFSLWLHLHSLILPIQQISFFCFPCSPSTNANNLQLKPVSRVEQNLNPTVKIKESVAEASLLWKANSEPKVSIRICFQLKTYLPVIIFYILPSLSLSLSLSTLIGLPPSCNSYHYLYFLSKRMQYFARTSWALSFWCLLCCLLLLPFCLCLLCKSIKQEELMTRSTWMLSLLLWRDFFL